MPFIGMLFLGCSKPAEIGKEGKFLLDFDDYASDEFLQKWNKATIGQLKKGIPNDTLFRSVYILNFQNDSINSSYRTRGKFLRELNEKLVLPDSLQYNAVYIIETEHSGEVRTETKYLIIDSVPKDYFYRFQSRLNYWDLTLEVKGDFSLVDDLYSYFSSGKGNKGEEDQSVGLLTITKATPDTLLSNTFVHPTEEQMSRISTFYKQIMKADSTARSVNLKQK
jgi:hypothetical protein